MKKDIAESPLCEAYRPNTTNQYKNPLYKFISSFSVGFSLLDDSLNMLPFTAFIQTNLTQLYGESKHEN